MNNIFKKLRDNIESKMPQAPTFDDIFFNKFCERIGISPSYVLRSIGTLGGG